MKRWVPFGIVLILVLIVALFLFSTVVAPERFTGEWYSSEDGSLYLFQEGIIACADHSVPVSDEETFSGAYRFGKNSIAIFVISADGPGEVKELYWEHTKGGDILCENEDGTGKIYFYRNKAAVPIGK